MKKYYPAALAGIVSVLLSAMYCPLHPLYFDDSDIFAYIGMVIKKGHVPYKDVFDHKPPLIYFFNYTGAAFGEWAFWFFDCALVLFATLKFCALNRKFNIIYPFVLPVLFNLILRNSIISLGYGMTREYTTIFLLLAFCLIAEEARRKDYFLGLLFTATFLMQQDQVILFAPLILYSIVNDIHSNKRSLPAMVIKMAAGAVTIILPVLFYFYVKGGLASFWQDAFAFNFTWYLGDEKKVGMIREIIVLKNYLFIIKIETAFLLAMLLAALSLKKGNTRQYLLLTALLLIPLSFISEILSSAIASEIARTYYYLLPLAATLPILLFVVFAFTKAPVFNSSAYQAVFGVLLVFNLCLSQAEWLINYSRYITLRSDREATTQFIANQHLQDYELYIMNDANWIFLYNRFKILSPAPWIYHFFWSWYKTWDTDNKKLQGIINDLETHHTRVIIYSPFDLKKCNSNNVTFWENYLHKNFRQVSNTTLWVRAVN